MKAEKKKKDTKRERKDQMYLKFNPLDLDGQEPARPKEKEVHCPKCGFVFLTEAD